MAKRKITCTFYMGGERIEKLTSEQCERMVKKVGEAMSLYYTAHPEEYVQLKSTTQINNSNLRIGEQKDEMDCNLLAGRGKLGKADRG